MQEGKSRLSVIVPAHRGGPELERCLQALISSERPPDELIVVDDGSGGLAAASAERWGAVVLLQNRSGPGVARNAGAALATGEVLVFVDSDVEVRPDTLALFERALAEHPQLDAVFGSYDDAPPHRNPSSLYANLRHHYVHQTSVRQTGTFWAGCGAIRRAAFHAVGGFGRGWSRPSIEDIDLGMRLCAQGSRILLMPEVQAKHCKRWSLTSLWSSDIFSRAVPWTRRLLQEKRIPAVLNLGWSSRISALAAWLVVVCLVAGWVPTAAAAGLVLVACNWRLGRFFLRTAGLASGLACCLLHGLYFLYSSLIFGALFLASAVKR